MKWLELSCSRSGLEAWYSIRHKAWSYPTSISLCLLSHLKCLLLQHPYLLFMLLFIMISTPYFEWEPVNKVSKVVQPELDLASKLYDWKPFLLSALRVPHILIYLTFHIPPWAFLPFPVLCSTRAVSFTYLITIGFSYTHSFGFATWISCNLFSAIALGIAIEKAWA